MHDKGLHSGFQQRSQFKKFAAVSPISYSQVEAPLCICEGK